MKHRAKFLIVFVLLLGQFIFRGCDGDNGVHVPTGGVKFVIADTISQAPIQFVSVMLGQSHYWWTASDEDGIASFTDLGVGQHTAHFYASLYHTKIDTFNVNEGTNTITVYLSKADSVDNTPPSVLGFETSQSGKGINTSWWDTDVWIFFSERMRKRSVDSAIFFALWNSVGASQAGNCDSGKIYTDTVYTTEWKESNIYHVIHPAFDSVRCYRPALGSYAEHYFQWQIHSFGLSNYARDFTDNNLAGC